MAKLTNMFWGAMPHALYRHFKVDQPERLRLRQEAERLKHPLELSARNVEFRHRHQGQRCFILCNGPSVKRQDITVLKGEHVFSVSSGYHHPDYSTLSPIYHLVPQLTYGLLTREDAINWFREMDGRLGRATLFLNYTEEALVRDSGLFRGRDIRYVTLAGTFQDYDPLALPDISKRIPGVQSVAIMCLMAAMYMGFTEIYLLGTDHDHFRTGEYNYFYEPTLLRGKDPSTDTKGNIVGSLYDELSALKVLWEQYRWIKRVAGLHGIRIFNASAGGALDEFPRIDLTAAAASGRPGTV
ncbi:hypothetical protein [Bradyrhizobium sp. CCBAU 51745]|uniref:hypothetical protein n=1 Tax=Bradyrhizobium sp. CCBAU 51745 TaxID=1325099 RepID=UPI0023064087|nr:hypothetical protein [Bradyrhizobium sp. CCBAU 51745]